jgi:hypothetical protein
MTVEILFQNTCSFYLGKSNKTHNKANVTAIAGVGKRIDSVEPVAMLVGSLK